MSDVLLYKELILPSLTKETQSIFPYMDTLASKFNTSKNLYSARSFSFFDNKNEIFTPILKIVKKYPFLRKHLRVFKIRAGTGTLIHLDGLSQADIGSYTINIPISGCSKLCPTEFYKVLPEHIFSDLVLKTRTIKEKNAKKIDEYFLIDNPFLCSHQIPHRVFNNSNIDRISVSWPVENDWTPDRILKLIDTGIYNV